MYLKKKKPFFQSIPGQAYLCRRVKTFVSSDYLANDEKINNSEARKNEEEEMDRCDINDPFEANSESEQPFVTEHHILWSMSYGVPVLYFNAWFSGKFNATRNSLPPADSCSVGKEDPYQPCYSYPRGSALLTFAQFFYFPPLTYVHYNN